MNFNYCSKPHTSPSREEEWKRKGGGNSSSSSPHFMRKRQINFGTKSVLLGQRSWAWVRFFKGIIIFKADFSQHKRQDTQWWDQCKNEAGVFVWEPWSWSWYPPRDSAAVTGVKATMPSCPLGLSTCAWNCPQHLLNTTQWMRLER